MSIGNKKINVKILGIMVDDCLIFKRFEDYACEKAAKAITYDTLQDYAEQLANGLY